MKLIIQIPCYNEAATLPDVVAGLPKEIPGVKTIEILVVDDGSTDETAELALSLGVHHVLRSKSNLGLARSFQRGLNACLRLGADLIVNTDGDNQYSGAYVSQLVQPIIEHRADVVIGDRSTDQIAEFSTSKRFLQRFGSAVVGRLSGVDVPDAVSGFRAYSREAALSTNVLTTFSYTTETLIQAGRLGLKVVSVPVKTNPSARPSRLARSMPVFVFKQFMTIVRSYTMYSPLRVFGILGLVMLLSGIIPIIRFLFFFVVGEGHGHIQSLVLGSMLSVLGYFTMVIALLSDTVANNRRIMEAVLERVRRIEIDLAESRDE